MLAGVGGWTVAEAKERISYAEFLDWMEYRERRGTFNQGMRLEFLMARLSTQVSQGLGGKTKFEEILRFHDTYEQEGDDIGAIAKLMGVREVRKNG